jgi:hypothetical protein
MSPWFESRLPVQLARRFALLAICLLCGNLRAEDFDFFEKKIRPVLVERCYKCHSASSEQVKGGLLLDTQASLLKGGDSGPVIVPGSAAKSRLIEAIRYQNKDLQMPPKEKLSDQQIDDFVSWINLGAPDPRTENALGNGSRITHHASSTASHWAFRPPSDHAIPKVKDMSWPNTPLDFFILAKLEEHNLSPAPPADKRTLIRRASFDLTGLPPRPADVDEFVSDKSPEGFAKVVDRLLASPRYGERWGRYWLDVARYADTKGYVYGDREEARFVHSHVYRDWVIRSFNEDLPYDRFLLLQIAADQIPPVAAPVRARAEHFQSPTELHDRDRAFTGAVTSETDSRAAMGFLTLGRRFLGVVHDIIDDRIDVVMRGTQALTVGCARCHDHKFDPIPTADYYSLYGIFAGGTERMLPLSKRSEEDKAYLDYEKGFKERVEKFNQTMEKKRRDFSNRFRAKSADYLVAVLDVKKLPSEEHYEIRGPNDLNPTIVRNWENYLLQTKNGSNAVFAPWHALDGLATDGFASKALALLDKVGVESASSNRVNPFVLQTLKESPVGSMRDVAARYGKLLAGVHQQWQDAVQKAATNNAEGPLTLPDSNLEELRQVLYGPAAPVNIPLLAAADMEWYFDEPSRVELMKLNAEIERWIIKSPGAPPHAVILEDRPNQKNPRLFLRGNPANKGDEVPRQFLKLLAGETRKPFRVGSGRLELAQAIASPDNPLTARVMVNRIWLHHFGSGLVRTASDFGTRSELPSHPELLDWLARDFIANGWSIKAMHRLILLSKVYQQSSDPQRPDSRRQEHHSLHSGLRTPDSALDQRAATVDPQNRLLWKMNRQRLDFESLRDSLLAVSGELEAKMGGAPVDLFKAPFSPRRAIYGYIDRQFLPGLLRVFDFANPDMHSPQRSDTTVPQQALFFMNSPFVVERARSLLSRPDILSYQDRQRRLDQLYRIVYQRSPTSQQLEFGLHFLNASEIEPLYEPPPPPITSWLYGYGEYVEAAQRIQSFNPLPYYTGDAWQGGENWPDQKLGWVRLTADGGHAGNDLQHAAIRRWIAPADAKVAISGTVKHDHQEGDGIQARIISSRHGSLGNWTVHKNKAEAKVDSVELKKGDALDFVVDYRANLNSDDFNWVPIIKVEGKQVTASSGDYAAEWNAKKEFGGPAPKPPQPLNAWERLAQVLLLSNEFIFVD